MIEPPNTPFLTEANQEPLFNFAEYLAILRRRWLVMLLVLVVTVTGGVMYTIRQPKIYEALVSIMIKPNSIRPLGKEVESLEDQTNYTMYTEHQNAERQIISSRTVLQKVVNMVGLASDYDFLGLSRLPPEQAQALVGKVDPVSTLESNITVVGVKDSSIIEIRAKDQKPNRAALLANALVDAYIEHRRDNKLGVVSYALSWLDEQVISLRGKLNEAETKMYEFQKKNNIAATSFEAHQNLISQRQIRLSDELLGIQRKKWEVESQMSTLKKLKGEPSKILNSPLAEENVTLKGLAALINELKQNHLSVSSHYGPDHPKNQEAQIKLKGAMELLSKEIAGLYEQVRQRKELVDRLADRTEAALAEVRQEAFRLNEITIEHQRLSYDIQNLRDLYTLVLKRSKETQVSGVSQFVDVDVVERATPPKSPISPKKNVYFGASALLGLFLAIGTAFLLETVDSKIAGAEEAERIVGRPYLGCVPEINGHHEKSKLTNKKVVEEYLTLNDRQKVEFFPLYFTKSNVAESIRLIRTNMLFLSAANQSDIFLVTSPHPSEGKSTIVNYLGASLAAMGKKVVLIDTDLHKPVLHRIFSLENKKGVSNWIVNGSGLDDIIQRTRVEGLDIITSGQLPPNSGELLSSHRMEELMVALRERYDYVILDSPPILALSDALILSRLVKGILLLAQPAVTDRGSLRATIRHLRDIQAPVLGFVLNRIEKKKSRYYDRGGYYSGYYTSSKYKRYSSYEGVYGQEEDEAKEA